MKKLITPIIFVLIFAFVAFPQDYLERSLKKGFTNPNELVSLSPTISYDQAIDLLSKISESLTGKRIVSTITSTDPINIELKNIPYDKALTILVQMNGLMYEEKEDVIVVKRKNEPESEKRSADTYAPVNSREVKISAVFFELNTTVARQRGLDWKFLLSRKGLDIGGKIGIDKTKQQQQQGGTGQQNQLGPEFELEGATKFDAGGFYGEATALFKFFENENLGEIIASPNIIVRDRNKGRIQVGSDISVKQRDFAGNVIENFFSTGSIIEVTPYVYDEDDVNYVLLDVGVERSSFVPDPSTTIINKTTASTQILMLDGEETIIGGLFLNEDTKTRSGIPFLKDLPWWVFGIRYIAGTDEINVNKKELVILLKTELVPTLKERLESPKLTSSPIQKEVKDYRNRVKYYQFNQTESGETKK
ncbi:MAG: hypothetical protein ABI550_00280 [Ignavibacteriaceae bacterium]